MSMSWPILYKNFGITVMLCLPMAHINLRPLQNAPFCPIPASGSNFNPQNTQCIPACPACPVAPADGTGVGPADRTGVVKIFALKFI